MSSNLGRVTDACQRPILFLYGLPTEPSSLITLDTTHTRDLSHTLSVSVLRSLPGCLPGVDVEKVQRSARRVLVSFPARRQRSIRRRRRWRRGREHRGRRQRHHPRDSRRGWVARRRRRIRHSRHYRARWGQLRWRRHRRRRRLRLRHPQLVHVQAVGLLPSGLAACVVKPVGVAHPIVIQLLPIVVATPHTP